MSIYIKIEDKEAFDWLANMIKNTLASNPNSHILTTAYPKISAWSEALDDPMTEAQLLKSEFVSDHIKDSIKNHKDSQKPRTKRKTTAKKPKPADVDPYKCSDHPNYTIKRIPRTDCDTCWKLYKQFYPLEYPQKRKNFERKLSL